MELWKNKIKGTYFISLGDPDGKKIKVVTPVGEIKLLQNDMFDGPFEQDESEAIRKGFITEEQFGKYESYRTNLDKKRAEVVTYVFEEMTTEEMDEIAAMGDEEGMTFIRRKYPRVYRRLLEKGIAVKNLSDLLSQSGAHKRE